MTTNWQTLSERPGYLGKRRRAFYTQCDADYGPGNWRLAWKLGERYLSSDLAYQIYEDAYWAFLARNPLVLAVLVTEASEVYDNGPSNVASGLDYSIQELPGTHLQDIAIRRVLVRLGASFRGDQLIQIRDSVGEHRLSLTLSPGQVPFHLPELIEAPELVGWWLPGSVECWYQSNRYLQVRV